MASELRNLGQREDELACIVLSLRSQPGLTQAVRSLLEQSEAAEVVVVNSGGGDPAGRLRSEGLEIPVIDEPQPLLPGAVRNIGIGATQSRYVAFLAADCVAEPGWVAGRLRAHRAGAAAVASVLTNAYPASRSANATFLLLHHRMASATLPRDRALYGLSYDRALFHRFGVFCEDLRSGEDTEFNARFRGLVPVALAPDVRTAHRNPTDPLGLVRDQFSRGRRRAEAESRIAGRSLGPAVAMQAILNLASCVPYSWRVPDRVERLRLLQALPLLVPGALAYALGALIPAARAAEIAETRKAGPLPAP